VSDWRLSWAKRLQVASIAAVGYPLISALGHTLRWRVDGLHHLDAIQASGRQPVMGFWHGRILPATFYFRGRGIVVITSENFDGEWIARIIERLGYRTARGSTTRGGRKAILQLVRDMKAGQAAGFTLDGPRGPARVAQPGAVWLAGAGVVAHLVAFEAVFGEHRVGEVVVVGGAVLVDDDAAKRERGVRLDRERVDRHVAGAARRQGAQVLREGPETPEAEEAVGP